MARNRQANNRTTTVRNKRVTRNVEIIEEETTRTRKQQPKQQKTHMNLKVVEAKTDNQRASIQSWCEGLNLCMVGSAGTGKSFVALYLALQELERGNQDKIIIVRSSAQSRQQGHLPGTMEEKMAPFKAPYKAITNDLLQCGVGWEVMEKAHAIYFESTSFIRGVTFQNAIVIIEEIQNMDFDEFSTVMTRIGENSRVIATGDYRQDDLKRNREKSGAHKSISVMKSMPKFFDVVEFNKHDIVRSPLVKSWIIAVEDFETDAERGMR